MHNIELDEWANFFQTEFTQNVAQGKRISMLGFGTFKLTHRAARKGRNPKTGEEIQIKASKTPSFSAGKAFKEKCNQ